VESKGGKFSPNGMGEKLPAKKILYIHCGRAAGAHPAAGLLRKQGYEPRASPHGGLRRSADGRLSPPRSRTDSQHPNHETQSTPGVSVAG
jgi:hypothetical protein